MSENPFDIVMKNLESEIQKIVQDRAFWGDVGNFAVNLIRKRTRLGYGVEKGGAEKVKLDTMRPLDTGYIETRKLMRKEGTLADTTNPNKNNLTLTGDMLDSLKYFFVSEMIYIGFDSGSFAKEKAEWNAKRKKLFNFLSSSEIKQIKQYIQKKMEEKLKGLGLLG